MSDKFLPKFSSIQDYLMLDLETKHGTPITSDECKQVCSMIFEDPKYDDQFLYWSTKNDGPSGGKITVDVLGVQVPIDEGMTGKHARLVRCVATRPDIPLEANFYHAECAAEKTKWDPISTTAKVIVDNIAGCDVMYGNFKVPFFTEREYIVYRRCHQVNNDKFYMLQRSAVHPKIDAVKPNKDCVWSETFLIAECYERVGEGVRLSIAVLNDPGGSMPRAAFTAFAAMAVRQVCQSCGQVARKSVKDGFLPYAQWWFKERVQKGSGENAIAKLTPPSDVKVPLGWISA